MLQNRLDKYKSSFGAYTELRAQVNNQQSVMLLKGNLTGNTSVSLGGVSARVYKNGVFGFASAPEYDDESIQNVVRAATDNAVFLDVKVKKNKKPLPTVPSGLVGPKLTDRVIDQSYLIDFAKALDEYIVKHYPKLASRFVSTGILTMEKLLITNDSTDSHSIVPRAHLYVGMTALDAAGSPVELFEPIGAFGLYDEIFKDPAALYGKVDHLYECVMQKSEGVYADAGVKDVIMHPDLAGILAHEAVGHTVEADLVLGGSVAGPNLGKRVASDLITMVDFAHSYKGKQLDVPVYVDDEGTVAEDCLLIENGMLRSFMHNKESAEHFGVKPTGNARAYRFSDEPLIRMRNTAILPGKEKLEDMIAAIDDGYYLVKTGNGQADTTGEFMFSVGFGYEIKKGKLGRAIRETTISGVAFDMLKTVDMVSDDMSWNCTGMCGKKQPIPVSMGGPAIKCKVSIGGR